MKRLLGVVLVLVVACIPMNIQAQEVDLFFDYSGQKVKIENAVKYYTIEGELLDEAPIDCGTYIALLSDRETIFFEINPKKVPVKVTYNKDWRENDSEEEKYLCDYVGDYKLTVQSKSKNYKYEIAENVVFSILGRDAIHRNETKGPSFKTDKEVEKTTHKETPVLNKSQSKITTGIQAKTFTYSITLMFSLFVIFIFIFKFI